MGVSAVCASATDLAFDLNGYLWQLVNCLFTAGYSLYLRGVMDKVKSSLYNLFASRGQFGTSAENSS